MINVNRDINRHPFAYLVLLVAGSPRRSTRSISRRRPGGYRFHILRQDAATTSRHRYRRLRNFRRGSDPAPDAQVTGAGITELQQALPSCKIKT